MTIKDTPKDELVSAFGQVVGMEKAEEMVGMAAGGLGLRHEERYSTEDVIDICEKIEDAEGGYVEMLAADLKVQKLSERRFDALLENIPDPAVVVTLGGQDPTIKTVNPAFESMFGYDLAEVEGTSLRAAIVPDEHHAEEHESNDLASDQTEREVSRETADGEIREFIVRSIPVPTTMGNREAAIVYTDISEQKRRQNELERQNEQLERFAQVVSHDLRNPLNVASGYLEMALDEYEDENLATVAESLDRMKGLIEDLLALAKQGQTVGETEPVELADVAREAWRNVDQAGATLEIDSNLPTVEADPDRLQEALENLFRNAIEHVDGNVSIRVARRDGGFSVCDDGPGIPPEDRPEVFSQGYTTNEDGTGFGLSIVESIVEAHGWEISVTESDEGGARFDVRTSDLGGRLDDVQLGRTDGVNS